MVITVTAEGTPHLREKDALFVPVRITFTDGSTLELKAGDKFPARFLVLPYSEDFDPDGDTDSDGIPNWADPDIDGDGLSNAAESDVPAGKIKDTDGDGLGDTYVTGPKTGQSLLTDRNGSGKPDFVDGNQQTKAQAPDVPADDGEKGLLFEDQGVARFVR